MKFGSQVTKWAIHCHQPRPVLKVIKSQLGEHFSDNVKCADENIVIKLGEMAESPIIATTFPCCCVKDGECLVLHSSTKAVQAQRENDDKILPKESYSLFLIDKEGGENSKSKANEIFRVKPLHYHKKFKYFCVCGEKGMMVEEALHQDGRFADDLRSFILSDNNEIQTITMSTEAVDDLHGKTFHISVPKRNVKMANDKKPKARDKQQDGQLKSQEGSPNTSRIRSKTKPDLEMKKERKASIGEIIHEAFEKRKSLKRAMEDTSSRIDVKEIYKLLCEQFSDLKKWMESRFPGESFKKALDLRRENFGNIHQSFTETDRMGEVLELGESVCLLKLCDKNSSAGVNGTGFVLFDEFVLTNCHLFDEWIKQGLNEWWKYVDITAEFQFRRDKRKLVMEFKATVLGVGKDADYAVLHLSPTAGQEPGNVPPGLLKRFGPQPLDGASCIIGHPAGGTKKMDPTCVIEKEDRERAIDESLSDYKEYFPIYSLKNAINNDPYADILVTYNTFMYHGASGSPVFDSCGRVFGLHTGGFLFGHPKPNESVIEYAFPLLYIFQKLVIQLKESGWEELLNKIIVEAEGNPYLKKILAPVVSARPGVDQEKYEVGPIGSGEPMDRD